MKNARFGAVIIAKSPIQLASAAERLIAEDGVAQRTVLLSRGGRTDQYLDAQRLYSDVLGKVTELRRWPRSPQSLAAHAARLAATIRATHRPRRLFLGADVSADSHLHLRLGRGLGASPWFVDNGVGTLTTLDWLRGEISSATLGSGRPLPWWHPHHERPAPPEWHLVSYLPLDVSGSDRERIHDPGFGRLMDRFATLPTAPGEAWFLGQPLPSLGRLSLERYVGYVRMSLDSVGALPDRSTYVPHPSEDDQAVTRISRELGLRVVRPRSGVEFMPLAVERLPEVAISPHSSALFTLPILSDSRIRAAFWVLASSIDQSFAGDRRLLRRVEHVLQRSGAEALAMPPDGGS